MNISFDADVKNIYKYTAECQNHYFNELLENINVLKEDVNKTYLYFNKAFKENNEIALKLLFYIRDIKEGKGERELFRYLINRLSTTVPMELSRNMRHIPKYGRWDDLYAFINTPLQDLALDILKEQFYKDYKALKSNKQISLLAKWLKSENASSQETKKLAKITREYFGISSKKYRKMLSALRKKINILETLMSKNKWEKIKYTKIPSEARKKYIHALIRHGVNVDEIIKKKYNNKKDDRNENILKILKGERYSIIS